ncbi:MAG: NfeD family protein [Candidatus Methylacidiphilales bacterium]
MDWTTIGGFIIAGFVLLAMETVLPGMVAGILGGVCLLVAVALSFSHGPVVGMVTFVGVFLLLMVATWLYFMFFPTSKMGKSLTLSKVNEGASAPQTSPSLVGMIGKMTSPGRPGGMAMIQGKRMDVVAESGFLEPGAEVKVVSVSGNRIVVRAVTT